jgi:hypothetical protein
MGCSFICKHFYVEGVRVRNGILEKTNDDSNSVARIAITISACLKLSTAPTFQF